jgi:hypothetical protein
MTEVGHHKGNLDDQLPARSPGKTGSPATPEVWEDVVASTPSALPSQTPTWMRCVCAVDGYVDASLLYETADGRRLVLPLARRRMLGPAAFAARAALPIGWGPGGLLCEGRRVRLDDVRLVAADLARRPALRVELRPDPATAEIWEAGMPPSFRRKPGMAQSVSLEGGFDVVWRTRFRKDTRNRVRRAERLGVVVERDDTGGLVPVFRHLYAKSVERWARQSGEPQGMARWRAGRREPPHKLPTVAAMLGRGCRLYVAWFDGQPVAAIVVLLRPTTMTYWRGAMDEELAGRSYANYLLHRTAIEDAAQSGCTAYCMGESAPGSPLALFKSRFGAVEQHYFSYSIERLPVTELARLPRGAARAIFGLRTARR